jgi:hypothetical protein
MGYLIINKINKNKIILKETISLYIINYVSYITLSTIPIILYDISIIKGINGYYIKIKNKESIQLLKDLDIFLKSKIINYKPILYYSYFYYIFFNKNVYIDHLFNKGYNEKNLVINIIKFKKYASHTSPIVYIL